MSATARLRFTQLVDLLLALLYDAEQQEGPDRFFDLVAMAQQLKQEVPFKWVFDVGKVLEARGLATCLSALGGAMHAQLTGEGRIYVEERLERGGVISDYFESRGEFLRPSGPDGRGALRPPGPPSSQTIEEQRRPAFELLDRIERQLREDKLLHPQVQQDCLGDVEAIRSQLRKGEPNMTVLASLLDSVGRAPSIASLVANLITLINA